MVVADEIQLRTVKLELKKSLAWREIYKTDYNT